jgi:hypothetical protein
MIETERTRPIGRLRRANGAMAMVVGLVVGSMLTAALVGGAEPRTTESGAAQSFAEPDGSQSTASDLTGGPATSVPVGQGSIPPASAGRPGAASNPNAPATAGPTQAGAASQAGVNCDLLQTEGVRGVTDTSIKIGFGLADLTALEPVLGPPAALGPQEDIFDAVLQAMRDEGRLPICGRDIEPVYMRYQVLEDATSRSVCQSFINDHQVFAVVTSFAFRDTACVTEENKTFLLDHGLTIRQEALERAGGRLFTLHPPINIAYETWTNWAIARPLTAPGAKVGIYYNNANADFDAIVQTHVIDVLRASGIEPVIHTSDSGEEALVAGDPNDAGAVLRFKQEGVTHVMQLITNFMEEAERQGYRPTYLFSGADAKDSNSGDFVPENANGALGIHWDQANEAAAGTPPSPEAERCIGYAEKAGVPRTEREWAQWNITLYACDVIGILIHGLTRAGSDLTTERLVLGLRTLSTWESHLVADGGYSESKQWLINRNREARYFGDCACWKNTGDWEPLFYR